MNRKIKDEALRSIVILVIAILVGFFWTGVYFWLDQIL